MLVTLCALTSACLAQSVPSPTADLRIDAERLNSWLRDLGQIGSTGDGGVERLAYSEDDIAARTYVLELMRTAGLETEIDAAGNLIGRRAGIDPSLAPIMLGSHIDSVPHGGNYDGPVGSLAAIEVAHTLQDAGQVTRHPLEFVVFSNEENGKSGSKAMAGELDAEALASKTHIGISIAEGMRAIGGEPDRLESVRRVQGSVAAFLELHIEQGAILDQADIEIGVVEGIVGIKRWQVRFDGHANHAGTTPMAIRHDALVSAAEFILAVNAIAREMPGRQVATVGEISAHPGAANVIPGRVELSLEIRELDMVKIDLVYARIEEQAERIAAENGTRYHGSEYYQSHAALTDVEIQGLISRAAAQLGLSSMSMQSGAGHDAQSIARFAPIGMIFIPSRGGISHSPAEYSFPAEVAAGANVLLQSLLALDRR